MVKYKTNTSMSTHMQHSKKLANWGLLQWIVVVLAVVAALFFADWTTAETEVLNGAVTWSATLAGVVCTGYMGNSSVEKFADRKYAITETLDEKG